MKIITPPPQDFGMYILRPETRWIEREAGDSLMSIYESGYLPYSGATGVQNVFYSARSARVVLREFVPTSENRRVAKKFDGMFEKSRVEAKIFKPDEAFWDLCLTYFRSKHGESAMPRERLKTILENGLVSTIVTYKKGSKIVAYVLEVTDDSMGHYWYSFYDLALAKQSLGLWLMLDCIRDAKRRSLTHYYLGTVYGAKALYKTNFKPLEWWNGNSWSSNITLLKESGRNDIA